MPVTYKTGNKVRYTNTNGGKQIGYKNGNGWSIEQLIKRAKRILNQSTPLPSKKPV